MTHRERREDARSSAKSNFILNVLFYEQTKAEREKSKCKNPQSTSFIQKRAFCCDTNHVCKHLICMYSTLQDNYRLLFTVTTHFKWSQLCRIFVWYLLCLTNLIKLHWWCHGDVTLYWQEVCFTNWRCGGGKTHCILGTKYCILHTKGIVSMPPVHTAIHRQVTQNAFQTYIQKQQQDSLLFFPLNFINKCPPMFRLWQCSALHCGKLQTRWTGRTHTVDSLQIRINPGSFQCTADFSCVHIQHTTYYFLAKSPLT